MPRPDGFHLCVQYYRQPTPPAEEWEGDLKHIKQLGFTAIQLRPQWAWHEVEEGVFRWDDIDRLMELTAKLGLKVLFKFFLESAPLWLFKEYEADRVTPDGTRNPHRGRGSFYLGGWMPCFDRPVVWEKAERFVANGLLRYRERENLLDMVKRTREGGKEFMDIVGDPADLAYDSIERELLFDLNDKERDQLENINHALKRIEQGTYGTCEKCGKRITLARLKAVPFARFCLKCKTASETPSR